MYAEAYYRAAAHKDPAEQEVLATKLCSILAERRHTHLLPRIVRELESFVRRRDTAQGAVVYVAQVADATRHAARIENDLREIGSSSAALEVRTDDTMIGGYDVRANGVRIDHSHKRALLELYGTLIT